jgi:dipeptidyl aminopeptidase/acylaminoacyl peptidase
MKILLTIYFIFIHSLVMLAQVAQSYQKPPQEILELVEYERAPSVLIDSKADNILLLYRDTYKTIEQLSEKELRLAGLRINPKTNIGSRTTFFNNLKLLKVGSKKVNKINGMPVNPRISNVRWSHDESKIAFTNTTSQGVELWVLNVKKKKAKKLTEANINANMRSAITWFKNDKSLLVKQMPKVKKMLIDRENTIPMGPTISVSDGNKAQNRTYQDLLKNKTDEYNFEQLATSELIEVNLKGKSKLWHEAAMFTSISLSPDGKYFMLNTIKKPFSYLVTYRRFPLNTDIYTSKGDFVKNVNNVPLIEDIPKGFMSVRKGMRDMQWRSDKESTLVWIEALDEGNAEKQVPFRDELFQLDAPFKAKPMSMLKTIDRMYYVAWGDNEHAIVNEYWWNTRMLRSRLFNPSNSSIKPKEFSYRNYQDIYSDPGDPVLHRNKLGKDVLHILNNKITLLGEGYSKKGQFPFVDQMDLTTFKTKRLYQSKLTDKKESLRDAIDLKKGKILVRIQSATQFPNYYIRDIKTDDLSQVTDFKNPFESLSGIHKEIIKYNREDGLELSGTLYLPAGYDHNNKTKLPLIITAYPEEFKDKSSASQSAKNPNDFTYVYWGSMIYWITQGYAILDDASFPIVGEGDTQPNDSFIPQLVSNGKAAIDAIDAMGYIDPDRVAVTGHSYGAFMVANLLSHSDLFAAGIARSGAYNRTLTPFGFQSEERSYWEAPEIYNQMSPFMNADTMNQPLLLVHGEADNNSGTYPLQSERYFNALKGLGATARLVMLPKESHGYRAKESILHLLWEEDQWLDKHVKNKK